MNPLDEPAEEKMHDARAFLNRGIEHANKARTVEALCSSHAATFTLEQATAQLVADARRQGVSWHEIGMSMGMTRQAAQQRYGSRKEWTKADTAAGLTPSMLR